MKMECEKCHKIIQVSRSEAIRVLWYKRKYKDLRFLCPNCYGEWEEEFEKAGDRIVERCKNLLEKLKKEKWLKTGGRRRKGKR